MATHKSDIITAKDSLAVSDKSVDGIKTGATVLQATAVYTMKGTEAIGDVIEVTELPPSAVVLPHDSRVSQGQTRAFEAGALELGDTVAPGRYGKVSMNLYGDNPVTAAFGYVGDGSGVDPVSYSKTTRLIATFNSTPSSRTVGGKLVFGISYTIKG